MRNRKYFGLRQLTAALALVMSIGLFTGTAVELSATAASASTIPPSQTPPKKAGLTQSQYVSILYKCDRAGDLGSIWLFTTYEINGMETYSFRECADFAFATIDKNMKSKYYYARDFMMYYEVNSWAIVNMNNYIQWFMAYVGAYVEANKIMVAPAFCAGAAAVNPGAAVVVGVACDYSVAYYDMTH